MTSKVSEIEGRTLTLWRRSCPVRRLRLAHGVSQVTLAEVAGLARNTVASIEIAERRPSLDTVAAIAHALRVDLGDLAKALVAWRAQKPKPLDIPKTGKSAK